MNYLIKTFRYLISSNRWSLAYRSHGNQERYVDIQQDKNLARADCFLIEENNKTYLFFEEFIIEPNRKGYLSVGELDTATNEIKNVKKVLEKEHHLSYPFVFKQDEKWFMIPETHLNKTIDLYKFTHFPYELEKVKTLISCIDAVDSTLYFKEGIYYIFTNVKTNKNAHNSNLSIYFSDSLFSGIFKPHPMNPIKTDNKYSRMAGAIFSENENDYRVAQDCSINYGSKMYKFRIDEISPTSYKETYISEINPPKVSIAAHTYTRTSTIEMIDIVKVDYSIQNIYSNFLSLLKSIFRRLKR